MQKPPQDVWERKKIFGLYTFSYIWQSIVQISMKQCFYSTLIPRIEIFFTSLPLTLQMIEIVNDTVPVTLLKANLMQQYLIEF